MVSLLQTELRKIIPYKTFWVILGTYLGLLFLFIYASSSITVNGQQLGNSIYKFPGIWQKLTYTASYFNLLLGILVIILVTDEYSFRTLRQQVIDGLSRMDLLRAKFLVALLISFFCTIFLAFLGVGFGITHNPGFSSQTLVSGSMHLVYYFVQAIGYLSIALFIAFLIRKIGLAIIVFLLYSLILERLLHWKMPDSLDKFFPMKVLGSLTPNPNQDIMDSITGASQLLTPQEATLPALIYIIVFLGLSYLVLKMRDL